MKTETLSQKEQILALLLKGWTCSIELQKVCWRYSARIFDLSPSYEIESKPCDCKDGDPKFSHWRVRTKDEHQAGFEFPETPRSEKRWPYGLK